MTREEQLKKEYEEKLATLRREQCNCNHVWSEPIYDPEIKRVPSDYEMITQGSDVWYMPSSYKEVRDPRWSRTCKNCGKVEYTKESVVIKTAPKF
jgi:hypothetical protein